MATDPSKPYGDCNQSPPFHDVDLFGLDTPLVEAVMREGAGEDRARLAAMGERLGSREWFERGRLANQVAPKLCRFDDKGFACDTVEFHPAYHDAMAESIAAGLHASPWEHLASGAAPPPGRHVARLAGLYMTTQAEAGHVCPVTMTHASIPVLLAQGDFAREWVARILTRSYDGRFVPWREKRTVTIGMGMTERQGGTDVRANTTAARPAGRRGTGAEYIIAGHKWFMSAPMCDAFLMLAQAEGGLSCFLVPRFLPDGGVNALRLQRLKDKLGNRSNASSEVELDDARGFLLGEEGRGVATIIEMVTLTRLDCAVASAGQMRLALVGALHHCRHRRVFGRALAEQPLMRTVLADMAIDVEAATALAFRLARSFDRGAECETEAAWRRLMTPVTKYWVCKMAPPLGAEAMECMGGNGYVEDGPTPRLYRELPLNAIWEGSGNVMALDLLRVVERDPRCAAPVLDEIVRVAGNERRIARLVGAIGDALGEADRREARARHLLELFARAAAGALLLAHAPPAVSGAFLATRLDGAFRHTYGASADELDAEPILERVLPRRT